MELRQLRHLLEVVRAASFRRAADTLGLTQPALSKSIRKLEDQLGVTLLERGPAGAIVTPYGQVLAEYAAFIEAEVDRVRGEIDAMKGTGRGSVRVGIGTALLRVLLPDIVHDLVERNPGLGVRIVEGLQTDLFAALRRGRVDIVVSGGDSRASDPDIVQRPLREVRIGLVCAPTHPLAGARAVELADLVPYRWILPDTGEQEEVRIRRIMNRAGLPDPAIAVRVSSSLSMAALLRRGALVSYLPRELHDRDPAYADLVRLSCPAFDMEGTIMLSYRRRAVLLPAARQLIAALSETRPDAASADERTESYRAGRRSD